MKPSIAVLLVALLATQASARTWNITEDGLGDAPTIQAGIDSAAVEDTVLVGPGTYAGPGNYGIDFKGKDLVLLGESGQEQTIIDLQALGTGIVFRTGETRAAVVDGLTFKNGFKTLGGAISCTYSSSPTIQNCTFRQNEGTEGGAIYVWRSSPQIQQCLFVENSGGVGGAVELRESVLEDFSDCMFINNSGNEGGGLAIRETSVNVFDCVFVGNSATSGGGLSIGDLFGEKDTDVSVVGCTFQENEATAGGGIIAYSSMQVIVRNCTFFGNVVRSGSGAAVWIAQDPFTMYNSIVAFNVGIAVDCSTADPELFCCDVYGNTWDWLECIADQEDQGANISVDPLFCSSSGGDLHLANASPCAPENSGECGLIGALGIACDVTPVLPTTWGRLKVKYGTRP